MSEENKKPAFDPNKPFQANDEKPAFDPSKPFEAAEPPKSWRERVGPESKPIEPGLESLQKYLEMSQIPSDLLKVATLGTATAVKEGSVLPLLKELESAASPVNEANIAGNKIPLKFRSVPKSEEYLKRLGWEKSEPYSDTYFKGGKLKADGSTPRGDLGALLDLGYNMASLKAIAEGVNYAKSKAYDVYKSSPLMRVADFVNERKGGTIPTSKVLFDLEKRKLKDTGFSAMRDLERMKRENLINPTLQKEIEANPQRAVAPMLEEAKRLRALETDEAMAAADHLEARAADLSKALSAKPAVEAKNASIKWEPEVKFKESQVPLTESDIVGRKKPVEKQFEYISTEQPTWEDFGLEAPKKGPEFPYQDPFTGAPITPRQVKKYGTQTVEEPVTLLDVLGETKTDRTPYIVQNPKFFPGQAAQPRVPGANIKKVNTLKKMEQSKSTPSSHGQMVQQKTSPEVQKVINRSMKKEAEAMVSEAVPGGGDILENINARQQSIQNAKAPLTSAEKSILKKDANTIVDYMQAIPTASMAAVAASKFSSNPTKVGLLSALAAGAQHGVKKFGRFANNPETRMGLGVDLKLMRHPTAREALENSVWLKLLREQSDNEKK